MYKLQIRDDEGRTTPVPLLRDEVTIGRKEGNTIRLTERNVSRRHARIVKKNGSVVVDDLSRYGTRLNGRRVSGPTELGSGDVLQIGDYELTLDVDERAAAEEAREAERRPREDSTAVVHLDRAKEAYERETAGRPRLVALNTDIAGTEYELSGEEMVLGRTDESDLVVDHRSISRRHARIRKDDGNWTVEDLDSANGIRVNDEEYKQTNLRRGDILELGHVKLRWVAPGESFTWEPGLDEEDTDGGGGKGLWIFLGMVVLLGGAWFAYDSYFSKYADETAFGQPEPQEVSEAEATGEPGGGEAGAAAAAGDPDDGDEIGEHVDQARAHTRAERWDEAIASWEAVLAEQPGHEGATAGLEEVEAEKKVGALYERMAGLVDAGDVEAAWTEVEALRAIEEDSAYHGRAAELVKAIEAGYVSSLLEGAEAALDEERWSDAVARADEVLAIDAGHQGAKDLKAEAVEGQRRAEAAERDPAPKRAAAKPEPKPEPKPKPTKAAKPEPKPEPAEKETAKSGKDYYREARRLQSKDPAKALALYQQAASKGYSRAWRQMGSIHIQQGNQAAAVKAYKRYLSLNPGAADAEVIENTIVRLGGQP